MGTGDSIYCRPDRYGTTGCLSVRTLQHLVPAEQLHRHTNSVADSLRNTVVHRTQLVVVGSEWTDNTTHLANKHHEPRIRMGGPVAHEPYRRYQPFRRTGIPYLYYDSMQLCDYQPKISSNSEKWLIFLRRS